jgi:hypothetical protein
MSADVWPEARYRESIWEGDTVHWPVRKARGQARPDAGDRLFCWYARTASAAPGVWGWGVVTNFCTDSEEVVWRPVSPSDRLKMDPIFDTVLDKRVASIRGKVAQGTLWPISETDADWLTTRVRSWVGGG